MLCYKQLWMVEQTFRTAKHLLATRPIFHKLDETIRGHVFCSFLALVLKAALEERIAALGRAGSWPEIVADLDPVDRDRDRARGQTLPPPLRAASSRQPRPARGQRRAAADRPRRNGSDPRPVRKTECQAAGSARIVFAAQRLRNWDCRRWVTQLRHGSGPPGAVWSKLSGR